MRRTSVVPIVALACAVVGCGGGSTDSPSVPRTTAAAEAPDPRAELERAAIDAVEANAKLAQHVGWTNRVPASATSSTRGAALSNMRYAAAQNARAGLRVEEPIDARTRVLSVRVDPSYGQATARRCGDAAPEGLSAEGATPRRGVLTERVTITLKRLGRAEPPRLRRLEREMKGAVVLAAALADLVLIAWLTPTASGETFVGQYSGQRGSGRAEIGGSVTEQQTAPGSPGTSGGTSSPYSGGSSTSTPVVEQPSAPTGGEAVPFSDPRFRGAQSRAPIDPNPTACLYFLETPGACPVEAPTAAPRGRRRGRAPPIDPAAIAASIAANMPLLPARSPPTPRPSAGRASRRGSGWSRRRERSRPSPCSALSGSS